MAAGKTEAGLRKRTFTSRFMSDAPSAPDARSAAGGRVAAPGILLVALAFMLFSPPPPILAESPLLNDIDEAITFHETKTQSQAHITFWKNVRSAIVAEAVPDSLKTEFDQRAGGAKPGGKFYQLYMDVKAEFERILTPPPIPTATISASPETIELGQPSTLTWSTEHADTVTLDQVAVSSSGSKVVSPVATTHYYLVASGEGGSTQATVTLEVTLPVLQQSDNEQESDQNTDQNTGVLTCTKQDKSGCRYWARWEDKSDLELEEGDYYPPTDIEIRTSEGLWVAGVTGATVEAPGWPANTTGSGANSRYVGDLPADWESPAYIRVQGVYQGGATDPTKRYGASPFWWARHGTVQTDEPNTRKTKISLEVNTFDDNVVQADKVYPLTISSHPTENGGTEKDTKRIVIKEDDFWRAQVEVKGGGGGAGRCLAWAACLQGPSPQENRYTIRSGIEFGQPGYDPNAAVTGCRYDLWDRKSACTKTTGGSGPKRLVINTGRPMAFAKGLDGPAGSDHYDLGEGEGGYYYINKQRRVDGGATTLTPLSLLDLYAYCDGPGCGDRPFVKAAPLPNPYETITIPANVFTDQDAFSRSLVGNCNSGAANLRFEIIRAKRILSGSVTIEGTPYALKLPPTGAQITLPAKDRIKFTPASINWCG